MRLSGPDPLGEGLAAVAGLIEGVVDGVVVLDDSFRVLGINRSARDLVQVPDGALTLVAVAELLPEAAELVDGRDLPATIDIELTPPDGGRAFYQATLSRLPPGWGDPAAMLLVLSDVSTRHWAEEALARVESNYRTLVEQVPAIVYTAGFGQEARWTFVSPQIESLLGVTPDEFQRENLWAKMLHPEDRNRVMTEEEIDFAESRPGPTPTEYRLIAADGRVVWIRDEAVIVRDEAGAPLYYQGLLLDISERKAFEAQLARQAFYDSVTGLPNRALFSDRVEHALARRARDEREIAVIFIDLDDFKAVNDSLGHDAGDDFLRVVGERLVECLRPSDTAARFGGDEFGVLLEDAESAEAATEVARRIASALGSPAKVRDTELFMGASMGISLSDDHVAPTAEELIRDADIAMYVAKRAGGHTVQVFEPGMHDTAVSRLKLKASLRAAISAGELELHYQPIVELDSRRIRGFEALVRWRHPQRGLLLPGDFIEFAEETGLVVDIGHWVLGEACRFAASLPDRGGFGVSVNLSARQLQEKNLVGSVTEALETARLDPSRLLLEVTERTLMPNAALSSEWLESLKDLGVRIAIDDFGTGYSSLAYLNSFPVDVLKVDRSFISQVGNDARLVEAIVRLGDALQLATVAEGVEQSDQMQMLTRIGCRLGQGFLFSRPEPHDEARYRAQEESGRN
jgi:diguanylate cyclase (GGDEF)-like protein/PAS domain S-box-containing protein